MSDDTTPPPVHPIPAHDSPADLGKHAAAQPALPDEAGFSPVVTEAIASATAANATATPTVVAPGPPLLQIQDLTVHYGRIEALHGISLQVRQGELVTLLGSNGAGKSTTMRAISGLLKPSSGSIVFDGVQLTKIKPHRLPKLGVVQVPEGRRIFPGMTVQENLDMGSYIGKPDKAVLEQVFEYFPRLAERRKQSGGTLSGGEQQMLAIGRALMAKPRLLLLDEPSMGLAPKIIQQIFAIIAQINKDGTTILLVEQNALQALKRSHRGYILETGSITKTGLGADLLVDPSIREAYLGVA